MSLARTSYPPQMIGDVDPRSSEPVLADIGMLLGANLTTHKGHTSGGALIGDTPNPAPPNPSGDFGHDHSGGEFGRAMFRSIATIDFGGGAFDVSNMLGQPRAYTTEHAAVPANVPTLVGGGLLRFWVPPCDADVDVGAYAALGVLARLELETTALRAADVITLVLAQSTPGSSGVIDVPVYGSLTTTGYLKAISGIFTRLIVKPGTMNTIYWSTRVVRENAGSPRACKARLDCLELGVFTTA